MHALGHLPLLLHAHSSFKNPISSPKQSNTASMAPLFFFLLLLLPLLSSSAPTSTTTLLLSLKQSLTTPSLPSPLHSWDASTPLCSWPRVSCDQSNSTLLSLDLSYSNLTGPFPTSLLLPLLPSILLLNLSTNHLNGSIPSLPPSSPLQILDLYDNDLSGRLPTSLPFSLLHLDLAGNYFSGTIPSNYSNFPHLQYLSLAGNDLSGHIPPELGNLTSLRQLYLGYYNHFDGGIPPQLGQLSWLTHLDLSSCGLQGTIPPELGNLKNLDTLFLQTNRLTGTIPPVIGNLTGLRALDLSNNALTGSIPDELSQLRKLYLFHLFINRLHGGMPDFVAELPELELLKLWQNNLTGAIPRRLGTNGRLREVDLSSNKLTGVIPETLCVGRGLDILILQNNFLFGPLPEDLGRCRTLTRVRLGQNYLSGTVPRGFLYLPKLQLVELQNNYLTGNLDEAPMSVVGSPSKLTQINLSNNWLYGSIPNSIGNFTNLQILQLGGNQFTGNIPQEVGNLKHILKIDLSRNNLSGSIPMELSGCTLLSYMDFSQNKLIGSLPNEISQIHILNYLNVSWNQLNGSIPKEFGSMKSLTSVDFSHNDLSGRVPENGQFAYFNSSSFQFNPRLCGSTLLTCDGVPSFASPLQTETQQGPKHATLPGKFKLLFALSLLACSLVFAITVIIKTRSMMRHGTRNRWKLTAFQKVHFAAQDIVECLKETNIIGRGGAGVVYRGCTPTGEAIAVKRLLGIGRGSAAMHDDNGFNAEIQTLGRIRHRNIVRLLAFCSNRDSNLLVYEYMPNGSLGEVLHGKRGGYLGWDVRLKIAAEAARGLCYLHHDCCPPILHRDVKSNNILLNADFEAHVADFGLAKFLRDTGMSECMSAIAGSYGYIAPEYAYTLKVDEKSDVYSFGVVLLELITGRKPVGDFGEEGMDIVQWAKMNTNWSKEGVVNILDKRLSDVPVEEAMQVFFVGMLCVQERSVERPTMREVVQMLGQAKKPYGALHAR